MSAKRGMGIYIYTYGYIQLYITYVYLFPQVIKKQPVDTKEGGLMRHPGMSAKTPRRAPGGPANGGNGNNRNADEVLRLEIAIMKKLNHPNVVKLFEVRPYTHI